MLNGIPRLRSDVAGREGVSDWPFSFLQLVAEGSFLSLQDLNAMLAAQTKAMELVATQDWGSCLPDVVRCVLASIVVIPKRMAREIGITP